MGQSSARNAEMIALKALKDAIGLSAMGFRFDRGLTGALTVTRNGTPMGAWWYDGIEYKFAKIAHRPSQTRAATPDDVVSQTIAMAANSSASASV